MSTVTLANTGATARAADVLVAPLAGVVPANATVELAGEVTLDFAASCIQAALERLAQRRLGSIISQRVLYEVGRGRRDDDLPLRRRPPRRRACCA